MRRRDALAVIGLGVGACTRRQTAPGTGTGPMGARPVTSVPTTRVTSITTNQPAEKRAPRRRSQRGLDSWRRELERVRGLQISRLRDYANRGRFPRYIGADRQQHIHHRELTDREPVFVDRSGTHCAVGYLMMRSGYADTATQIARSDNNVYIEEVDDGPLIRWIEVSGLTQQEAAFVQPSYRWEPEPEPTPRPVKPPPRSVIAIETERLLAHFSAVEKQLVDDSEMSIDEALHRLKPKIERGARLGRLS